MAAPDGQIGYGVTFEYSTDGNSWTEVEGVFDVTPPAFKGKKVQIKYHNIANDAIRNRPNPLHEWDDAKFVFTYSYANYAALLALKSLDRYYRINYSDSSRDTWQGFIYEVSKPTPLEEEMKFEVTLAIDGEVTPSES